MPSSLPGYAVAAWRGCRQAGHAAGASRSGCPVDQEQGPRHGEGDGRDHHSAHQGTRCRHVRLLASRLRRRRPRRGRWICCRVHLAHRKTAAVALFDLVFGPPPFFGAGGIPLLSDDLGSLGVPSYQLKDEIELVVRRNGLAPFLPCTLGNFEPMFQ